MTPDPTLTDEELAEIESRHRLNPALYGRGDRCSWCFSGWPCDTSRLIADLRASREEVERLEAERANADDLLEAVRRNLNAAGEEVERLRQALWDIYGILGFDQDGDRTPHALVHPDLVTLVVEAAKEYRAQQDEYVAEIDRHVDLLNRYEEAERQR